MVKNRDSKGSASRSELAGDGAIFGRRSRISGRVVVNEDDSGRPLTYRDAEDFTRVNQGRIEDASSDKHLPKDLVARIEE